MKQRFSDSETTKASDEIAALSDLSVSELKDRWRSLYGAEPVLRKNVSLLA